MNWVVDWETDDNMDMWSLYIERENEERYWELASIHGDDWALEEMDEERRVRVVREELREEKLRRAKLIQESKIRSVACVYMYIY